MSNYHQYFVQYMLKNGWVTVDGALIFIQTISNNIIDNLTKLKSMVIEINRKISGQSFKLVFGTCEVTNVEILIWINMKNDDIAKLQLIFSEVELEYFHVILQEIINSEEHRLTTIVCINITSTLTQNFQRTSGQNILNKWIKSGYLVQKDHNIYLGYRTIVEFASYLRSHCPNSICCLCSELMFVGKQCAACYKIIHGFCIDKYLKTQESCPNCQITWNESEEFHFTQLVLEGEASSSQRRKRHLNASSESEDESGSSRRKGRNA